MLKPGQEVYVETSGILERVVVVREIDDLRHIFLEHFPDPSRQIAISPGPGLPVEVVRFDELRFG